MVLSLTRRSRGQIRLSRPSGIQSGGVIAQKDLFWPDFKQIQFSEWLDSVAVPFPGRSRRWLVVPALWHPVWRGRLPQTSSRAHFSSWESLMPVGSR